jgi:hypothetical protein
MYGFVEIMLFFAAILAVIVGGILAFGIKTFLFWSGFGWICVLVFLFVVLPLLFSIFDLISVVAKTIGR